VLRKIYRPKRNEVNGGWRKLQNEGLRKFYCSPSVIRMTKPKRILAGDVARTEEKRNA
jgi:hypothetical protein